MQVISYDDVYELIESKQKALCPVGRYGRNAVYGTDVEKYDAWEEILEDIASMDKYELPEEESVSDVPTNRKIKLCSFEDACRLKPDTVHNGLMVYGMLKSWKGWGTWVDVYYFDVSTSTYSSYYGYSIPVEFVIDTTCNIPNRYVMG